MSQILFISIRCLIDILDCIIVQYGYCICGIFNIVLTISSTQEGTIDFQFVSSKYLNI